MVYFRDHRWLLLNSQSRLSAFIAPGDRTREDVNWHLDLRYTAAGAQWRRVQSWHRPSLWIGVAGFHAGVRDWTELEHTSFWDPESWREEEKDPEHDSGEGEELAWLRAGFLNVHYQSKPDREQSLDSLITSHLWRVAAREDHWFTVELAAFAGTEESLLGELNAQEIQVPAGGDTGDRPEPDADFWRKHAELYLVETIPFGTVTVRVPRNVRATEAYALRRARELIGVGEPEHIEINDFYERDPDCGELIRDDIFVELQFNGFFED